MQIDPVTLLVGLDAFKHDLVADQNFEGARLVADAMITIETYGKRPMSEAEIAAQKKKRLLEAHFNALEAVYNYFQNEIQDGNLLDPGRVAEELAISIRDFS